MNDLFINVLKDGITAKGFFICTAVSLILGIIMAVAYSRKIRYTQSFVVTLIILPAIVQTVIMLVNGNIGTGIAVAGAFSLVRFRSVPGNAKEISVIFTAMAAGLACGTGYVGIAIVFTVIMCLIMLVVTYVGIGAPKASEKLLKITIPESLDYEGVFEEIFENYTKSSQLITVKTSNLGSLFKLSYLVVMKNPAQEKEMIDRLREHNGNLEISLGRPVQNEMTL